MITTDRAIAEDWHAIQLGEGGDDDESLVDVRLYGHLKIVGPPQSGLTATCQRYAYSAVKNGWDVFVIETANKGAEYTELNDWIHVFTNPFEAAEVTAWGIEQVVRREKVLAEANVESWDQLAQETIEAENIMPIAIIVDGFDDLISYDSIDIDAPIADQSPLSNIARDAALHNLALLSRDQQQRLGIYLVLATSGQYLGGEIWRNFPNTVTCDSHLLVVNAESAPHASHWSASFAGLENQAIQAAHDFSDKSRPFAVIGVSERPAKAIPLGKVPVAAMRSTLIAMNLSPLVMLDPDDYHEEAGSMGDLSAEINAEVASRFTPLPSWTPAEIERVFGETFPPNS